MAPQTSGIAGGQLACTMNRDRRHSSRTAVIVFTNGNNGMRVAEAVVEAASGHEHPAFDWL